MSRVDLGHAGVGHTEKRWLLSHRIGRTSPSSPNLGILALSNCPFELLNLI